MDTSVIYRGKLVVPRPGVVIDDGAIVVAKGTVAEAGAFSAVRKRGRAKTVDLGDVVIVPGLVNAHTHLELTHLKGQPTATDKFTDWLWEVMNLRAELSEDDLLQSAKAGIAEAISSGTTCVGTVSHTGVCARISEDVPIRRIIFHELAGHTDAKERITRIEARLRTKIGGAMTRHGIAPHAPYSTCREIYLWSIKVATGARLPLSTHAAESLSEAEFLATGRGEFRDHLARLGITLDGWKPPGLSPIAYLESLGFLKACAHLAHCNYLSDNDIARIQNISVVFCPRSHAYFGHKDHPFKKLRKRGINVALGTDSLASNESLSMLDEMKFLHSEHVEPSVLLEMGTIAGAKALGMSDAIGTLEPGKFADLCAITSPAGVRRFEDILAPDSFVTATVGGGKIIWRKGT